MRSDRNRTGFQSMRVRAAFFIVLISVLLIIAMELNMVRTVRTTVEEMVASRMEGDIHYIEDLIGPGKWRVENGALYCGDILIGDGTEENAFLGPFLEMEDKTGTYSYAFVRCSDDGLGWEGDKKSGYQQGHYLRVAGSSLAPDGSGLVGTYIEKKVAEAIDRDGIYVARANVVGKTEYCLYKALTDGNGDVIGIISVGRSTSEIENSTRRAGRAIFLLVSAVMAAAAAAINIYIFRSISKLDKVNGYLDDISTGVFPSEPLDLNTKDELMITAERINEMTKALKEKARISGELEAAADIQAHMLPDGTTALAEQRRIDIHALMKPAREIGGDFYDYFMTDDDRLAVVIADVSGKGVPAALIMAITKMLIKDHVCSGLEPGEVFNTVNRLLCEGNEDTNVFVTAWLGILDLNTGMLTYVNAGHNAPLVSRPFGGYIPLRAPAGLVLGAYSSIRYSQQKLVMSPGDRLLLYTDGITEATDADSELYGAARLKIFMEEHGGQTLEAILDGLRSDVEGFASGIEQADDMTMLMLEYKGNS